MSWNHVEDTTVIQEPMTVSRRKYDLLQDKYVREPAVSSQTIALSTWRCSNCRALAVTRKGEKPGGQCLKCHC